MTLLAAVLGFALIGTPSVRADHGSLEVDLQAEALGIISGWSMVLPIASILAGFVLFVVGLWLWSTRGQHPPAPPPDSTLS